MTATSLSLSPLSSPYVCSFSSIPYLWLVLRSLVVFASFHLILIWLGSRTSEMLLAIFRFPGSHVSSFTLFASFSFHSTFCTPFLCTDRTFLFCFVSPSLLFPPKSRMLTNPILLQYVVRLNRMPNSAVTPQVDMTAMYPSCNQVRRFQAYHMHIGLMNALRHVVFWHLSPRQCWNRWFLLSVGQIAI